MTMRHLFIINPAAGKRENTARLEEQIARLDFPCQVAYTREAGDAERIARSAAADPSPVRIYACGGDGTLNEVVNGAAGCPNAAITNVPTGTGNDFLKIFGPDFRRLFWDLPALAGGPEADFDLIECGGRLGIDIVCTGIDARVGAGVHRYKRIPLISGMGAYILSLAENVLFKGLSRPMEAEINGEHWSGDTALLCVCSGRYYGGGFQPVPDAMPDDGVLDILLIPKVSLFTFARLVGKYAAGRYRDYPELIRAYRGQSVTISAEEDMAVVVDGEPLRGCSFDIRLSEKKIRFFYPRGASYQPRV